MRDHVRIVNGHWRDKIFWGVPAGRSEASVNLGTGRQVKRYVPGIGETDVIVLDNGQRFARQRTGMKLLVPVEPGRHGIGLRLVSSRR
jgi:hypothetical protein